MKAKLVIETINEFHKTGDPLRALGLGLITIELVNFNLRVTKKLKPILDEDSRYLFDVCKENNIKWEIVGTLDGPGKPIIMEFTATKDDLIPLLVLFDAYGRDEEQLREDLIDWNGDQEELENILF